MRAHYLQHVPFEGLGSMELWFRGLGSMEEPWLRACGGYQISSTRFFESTSLPRPEDVDLLVVMGGPMSVNDENELPWLIAEKQFIRRAIDAKKAVLGVCLGAQLIANVMGASVYPNREKEIGWFPIQAVPAAGGSSFRFPPSAEVFHWHGETFDLPPGAIHLARSEGCENQAFQIGQSVIGLQFHLETTPETARELVRHCRGELLPARYVQSEAHILAVTPEKYHVINGLMIKVLSYLLFPSRDR